MMMTVTGVMLSPEALADLRACSHLPVVLPDQIEGETVVYLDAEFQT